MAVGLILGCKSLKENKQTEESSVTVQFDLEVKDKPFEGCQDTFKFNMIEKVFKSGDFKILVDSTLAESYEKNYVKENEIYIHRFTSLSDTSVKFIILEDAELYESELGHRLEKIQPHEGVVDYIINSDSALFKANVYKEEQDSIVSYVYENRIQYYDPKSKRFYYLFVVQKKGVKSEINMFCECEFKKTIESFKVIY